MERGKKLVIEIYLITKQKEENVETQTAHP